MILGTVPENFSLNFLRPTFPLENSQNIFLQTDFGLKIHISPLTSDIPYKFIYVLTPGFNTWRLQKDHAYLNKPAAFRCWFVLVCTTF